MRCWGRKKNNEVVKMQNVSGGDGLGQRSSDTGSTSKAVSGTYNLAAFQPLHSIIRPGISHASTVTASAWHRS